MSALPSLADVLVIVILLVPGFIALIIIKKIAIKEGKLTDLETTIYSLFASLIIYAAFGYITKIDNIDLIRDNMFYPGNLTLILSLAIIPSLILGYISRRIFKAGYQEGDCWAKCFEATRKNGSYILVYTSDGKEYKGETRIAGVASAQKEVVVNHPKLIIRDKKYKVIDEMDCGEILLFSESDIKRIVFLNSIAP